MKVRVLKGFEDFYAGVIRQAGEVFETSKVRFKALQSALPMDFVEEVEEETEE